MKRLYAALFGLGILAARGFSDSTSIRLETLRDNGDLDGLKNEYATLSADGTSDPENLYLKGKAQACILSVRESIEGENPANKTAILEAITSCRNAASSGELAAGPQADACYLVSLLYNRLIRDAASWMQYNADKDKYLRLALEANPDHRGARLVEAAALINMPAALGGNPAEGKSKLDVLYRENPENLPVILQLADCAKKKGDYGEAEALLVKAAALFPGNAAVKKSLDEFLLIQSRPVIRSIRVEGKTKTPRERIESKVESFIGREYSFEAQESIAACVAEIRSTGGCLVKAERAEGNTVDVLLDVHENNLIILEAIGLADVSVDYGNNPKPGGFPALVYIDGNFLGTADSLFLVFAGVYARAEYENPGLIGDKGPDLKAGWSSLFYDSDCIATEDGKARKDLGITSPIHTFSLGIGKKTGSGFSAFAGAEATYRDWKKAKGNHTGDFIVPEHRLTVRPFAELEFSTIGGVTGSKLDLLEGFSLRAVPALQWQPGYRAWGSEAEGLYGHDGKPALLFSADSAICKKIGERQDIRLDLSWKSGINMYRTDRWSIGNGDLMAQGASLDGYYANELQYKTGAAANLTWQVNVLPSKLAFWGKYDIFLDIGGRSMHSGTAIGCAGKIPLGMELAGQAGIGLDAKRDGRPGLEGSVMLTKMWMF